MSYDKKKRKKIFNDDLSPQDNSSFYLVCPFLSVSYIASADDFWKTEDHPLIPMNSS